MSSVDAVSLRIASAASMTSKPSEDEESVDEVVAPEAEEIASVLATEVGAMDTVASSDAAGDCKIAFLLRNCKNADRVVLPYTLMDLI